MKILQINSVYGVKSTGRIAADLVRLQEKHGAEAFVACSSTTAAGEKIFSLSHSRLYDKANVMLTRLFGRHGFYNKKATRRLIKYIDGVKPDIIHLHNVHGHYLNIKMLFSYIAKHSIPVAWTLHDCWSFTGHCPHFDYVGCEKWRTGCHNCSQRRGYPDSWFFDRSKRNYKEKKRLFTLVEKMHIVTPSNWLAGLVKESYLGKYPVTVVHNGIDTEAFLPVQSDIKARLGLEGKFLILGIVNALSGRKGGEYFRKLSEKLKDDEHIILLSYAGDPAELPGNITALPRTNSTRELAEIYSAADVFVNPTLEDTFPTVNLEALSCGTPVVTFDTGGSKESLNEDCGIVVPQGDTDALYAAVEKVKQGGFDCEACRKRGLEFTREQRFEDYMNVYNSLTE